MKDSRPIDRFLHPFRVFGTHKLAGAFLLMAAAAAAVIWANSPWGHSYHHLIETPVALHIGDFHLEKHLLHWINDGLMGIFFFVVGLEIKREVKAGELSTLRKAALPAVAAAGGMVVPALFYYALNPTGPESGGWGIPMATDIAFALGVLALLGDRVPVGLKVFLTALAIVDDIGAVLVIAIFYTDTIALYSLVAGLALYGLSFTMNRTGVRSPTAYFIVGTLVWLAFLQSGVHATIAAILMAFTIPSRTRVDGEAFLHDVDWFVRRLREVGVPADRDMNSADQQHVLDELNGSMKHASSPLLRLEHTLVPIVTFLVLPIFALGNAGVSLGEGLVDSFTHPVSIGIILGLFLGKQIGITLFAWIAVKLRLADLPSGTTWWEVHGVAMLGGVGFTMSLFIAGLAFPTKELLEVSKVGILSASLLSGVIGLLLLRVVFRRRGAETGAPDGETEGEPAEAE